jgi:hypothetical protein
MADILDEIFGVGAASEAPDGCDGLGYLPAAVREALATHDPDKPMRLAKAAALCGFKAAALRTEARKGRLAVSRVAGKDYVTLADIGRMLESCRVNQKVPDSGSDPLAATQAEKSPKSPTTSSRTVDDNSALDAALALARKLKDGSPPTSLANTRQSAANVHYLKSR